MELANKEVLCLFIYLSISSVLYIYQGDQQIQLTCRGPFPLFCHNYIVNCFTVYKYCPSQKEHNNIRLHGDKNNARYLELWAGTHQRFFRCNYTTTIAANNNIFL